MEKYVSPLSYFLFRCAQRDIGAHFQLRWLVAQPTHLTKMGIYKKIQISRGGRTRRSYVAAFSLHVPMAILDILYYLVLASSSKALYQHANG